MLKVDLSAVRSVVPVDGLWKEAVNALEVLDRRSGAGNDFLGWLDLPEQTPEDLLLACEAVVSDWKKTGINLVVAVGIGGSYLGAKATLEALSHTFAAQLGGPQVVFAGQNLSEDYHRELLELMEQREVAVIVISKSGTTTEPAVAFRILKEWMEKKYGQEQARKRIVAVTDAARGALKGLADREGYRTFVIPDDVGGRFSVLTPVGLLPIAAAGFDIRALMQGARDMAVLCREQSEANPALLYAAARNALYRAGKKIEILVNFTPKLQYIGEWWKQLYGESEGKQGKGIFPASVNFTTDLHSMGQYIQDGERTLFETVLSVVEPKHNLDIPVDPENLDGLNFLAGRRMEACNRMAELGTRLAHIDGGVPNIRLELPRIDEYHLGALYFFFEKACGISAYMLGVNPFDQPGVEDYKKNMFALLGKPGYEEQTQAIQKRI